MASKTGIFLAGVGTTFIVLGAGFGGGLFMANSALKVPASAQARVSSPAPGVPARVILPSTAEAAQAPEPAQQVAATPEATPPPQPQVQVKPEPVKDVQTSEKRADVVDVRKSEVEEKERRRRYAERKAKRLAAERAKGQQRHIEQEERREAPIMAFEGDDTPPRSFANFFGNN